LRLLKGVVRVFVFELVERAQAPLNGLLAVSLYLAPSGTRERKPQNQRQKPGPDDAYPWHQLQIPEKWRSAVRICFS
jgi:hypothetical protein